ncbi:hypothetical protein AgCh_011911 [Apium graveolens]
MMSEVMESMNGEEINIEKDDKAIMRYSYRIWVPNVQELKDEILDESHCSRYIIDRLMDIYIREIVVRYGVPMPIVTDQDPRFNSKFWRRKSFQECAGTKLSMSTAYNP